MSAPPIHRVGRIAATTITAAAVVLAAGSCASLRQSYRADYCAIMPDSVGLYPGNPVTQMGYAVGTVRSIDPGLTSVRVTFTVTTDRRLPRDVKAITRSTSVLADRSLELVGNAGRGPQLAVGECIPLSRSFTPKSLSEVIGSATKFINSISPDGSTNVSAAVRGIDQAIHGNGAGINNLLTTTSEVVDSPDEAVNDIGAIIRNLAQLTSLLRELRAPLKEILLDVHKTAPDVLKAVDGGDRIFQSLLPIMTLVSDLEVQLGETTQFTLDATSMAVRKLSAHAPRLANLLNPIPWWINSVANIANNHQFGTLRYRPPLYRIRTPNGVALCNIMNARTPGSCANVQGTPYAVDVSLLEYVFAEAANR